MQEPQERENKPSAPRRPDRGVRSDRWTYGIALVALLAGAGWLLGSRPGGPAATEDPHAAVARRAEARLSGARCVGAAASPPQQEAIARMLAIDTLAPRGALPSWLPADFAAPATGPSGADAWQSLSATCPDAPAFGTPFGFPSAEIEKALRSDPAFAAASDRQWATIRSYETGTRPQ